MDSTSFTVISDTEINTVVPSGAVTGPVSVTTPAGTGSSGSPFTITTPPVNQPPTAFIEEPTPFGPMRGRVRIRVSATDPDSPVESVDIRVDGDLIGMVTEPDLDGLWSLEWNSNTVAAGYPHSISVIARDVEGAESAEEGIYNLVVRVPAGDFDGDGTSGPAVFRPATGAWYEPGQAPVYFGLPGDIPVPADYDGDNAADRAVYRAGAWYVEGVGAPTYFGLPERLPVPGDYDGDGDAERAVFRPSVGGWFIEGQPTVFFGLPGDVPVPGDYDGDGDVEPAVWRPDHGGWYVQGMPTEYVGLPGDVPVPGDFDGDGAVEPTIWRPAVGGWYFSTRLPTFVGLQSDLPVLSEFEGNGQSEVGVWRPAIGGWYIEGTGPGLPGPHR